jgi:hypothetical protein
VPAQITPISRTVLKADEKKDLGPYGEITGGYAVPEHLWDYLIMSANSANTVQLNKKPFALNSNPGHAFIESLTERYPTLLAEIGPEGFAKKSQLIPWGWYLQEGTFWLHSCEVVPENAKLNEIDIGDYQTLSRPVERNKGPCLILRTCLKLYSYPVMIKNTVPINNGRLVLSKSETEVVPLKKR